MLAVLGIFSSFNPTQSYFFFSGARVKTNVSPVPKYDRFFVLCLRSRQKLEQNAPNIWNKPYVPVMNWTVFQRETMFVTYSFSKGDNVCDFLVAFLVNETLQEMGSTLKGKNLLLWEQILSFKSWPPVEKGCNKFCCSHMGNSAFSHAEV